MSKEFKLSSPVSAHGENISVLTLREPTGKDLREIGYPYKMGTDEAVTIDAERVARYIVKLANIPLSSVDAISVSDMNKLAWDVVGFFLESETGGKTQAV